MNSMIRLVLCLALVAALGATTSRASRPQDTIPMPRYERVDHFWWLVRDLNAVESLFRDTLGFTLGPDVAYRPADLRHIWFADGSFLSSWRSEARRPRWEQASVRFFVCTRAPGRWACTSTTSRQLHGT